MSHVRVRVHIAAPIDRVFGALSDHERFLSDRLTTTKVIVAGKPDRNGLGSQREVSVGPAARFVEEVTAWDPPRSYEYLIRESSLPVAHEGGRVVLTPGAGGTDVEWTTRFQVPVPVVGPLLGYLAERIFVRAFTQLLRRAKSKLEPAA